MIKADSCIGGLGGVLMGTALVTGCYLLLLVARPIAELDADAAAPLRLGESAPSPWLRVKCSIVSARCVIHCRNATSSGAAAVGGERLRGGRAAAAAALPRKRVCRAELAAGVSIETRHAAPLWPDRTLPTDVLQLRTRPFDIYGAEVPEAEARGYGTPPPMQQLDLRAVDEADGGDTFEVFRKSADEEDGGDASADDASASDALASQTKLLGQVGPIGDLLSSGVPDTADSERSEGAAAGEQGAVRGVASQPYRPGLCARMRVGSAMEANGLKWGRHNSCLVRRRPVRRGDGDSSGGRAPTPAPAAGKGAAADRGGIEARLERTAPPGLGRWALFWLLMCFTCAPCCIVLGAALTIASCLDSDSKSGCSELLARPSVPRCDVRTPSRKTKGKRMPGSLAGYLARDGERRESEKHIL